MLYDIVGEEPMHITPVAPLSYILLCEIFGKEYSLIIIPYCVLLDMLLWDISGEDCRQKIPASLLVIVLLDMFGEPEDQQVMAISVVFDITQ